MVGKGGVKTVQVCALDLHSLSPLIPLGILQEMAAQACQCWQPCCTLRISKCLECHRWDAIGVVLLLGLDLQLLDLVLHVVALFHDEVDRELVVDVQQEHQVVEHQPPGKVRNQDFQRPRFPSGRRHHGRGEQRNQDFQRPRFPSGRRHHGRGEQRNQDFQVVEILVLGLFVVAQDPLVVALQLLVMMMMMILQVEIELVEVLGCCCCCWAGLHAWSCWHRLHRQIV